MDILLLHTQKHKRSPLPCELTYLLSATGPDTTRDLYVINDPVIYTEPFLYKTMESVNIAEYLISAPLYQNLWAQLQHAAPQAVAVLCNNDDLQYTMALTAIIKQTSACKIILIAPTQTNFYPVEIYKLLRPDVLLYRFSANLFAAVCSAVLKDEDIQLPGIINKKTKKVQISKTPETDKNSPDINTELIANAYHIELAFKELGDSQYSVFSQYPVLVKIDNHAEKLIETLINIRQTNHHTRQNRQIMIDFVDNNFLSEPAEVHKFFKLFIKYNLQTSFVYKIRTKIQTIVNIADNPKGLLGTMKKADPYHIIFDTVSLGAADLAACRTEHSAQDLQKAIKLLNNYGFFHKHNLIMVNHTSTINSIIDNLKNVRASYSESNKKMVPSFIPTYMPIPYSPIYTELKKDASTTIFNKILLNKKGTKLEIINPIYHPDEKIARLFENLVLADGLPYLLTDTPNEDYAVNLDNIIKFAETLL